MLSCDLLWKPVIDNLRTNILSTTIKRVNLTASTYELGIMKIWKYLNINIVTIVFYDVRGTSTIVIFIGWVVTW